VGGSVRIILAVIASACAISILIDSPSRELAAQLDRQWQEYREHVGEIPAFPATSENLSDSFHSRLDTKR
jgi:protein-S-isoprenylcysteine O-methyltransferase Ste14